MPEFKAERVWLAPMSGSTDAAFRRQAVKFGAPAVVSEMVAGEALVASRPDMVRKTCRHYGDGLWIVQLAARRPEDMRAGAALLADLGVDVIDINMGCPSRQVTGGKSGSALMQDPDLALKIIDAALEGAGDIPVTLKMRLGWDDNLLNAPEIGKAAQDRGIQLLTVHGRTRCQFYKGQADWARIRDTVERVDVPVIANGDITSVKTAKDALSQSGAFGVMVGRACMGQPWLVGEIAAALGGTPWKKPTLSEQLDSLCEQIEDSLSLYGRSLGLRIVRKHISASIDKLDIPLEAQYRRKLQADLCRLEDPAQLLPHLRRVYERQELEVAA
ncbi:MAG: tRNA dihydrouridine synthase DusB [Pseudomonadota bacterium]